MNLFFEKTIHIHKLGAGVHVFFASACGLPPMFLGSSDHI